MNKEQLEQLSDSELSNAIIQTNAGKMDHSFDINDANCMMPLVFENSMTIDLGVSSLIHVYTTQDRWDRPTYTCWRKVGELRAAAIAYLLIKEGE